MSMTVNPRSIGIEGHYITDNVHELAALKARLEASGATAPQAAGVIGWLVDKAAGRPDPTSSRTRSTYRKMLAELGEHTGPPDESPRILVM